METLHTTVRRHSGHHRAVVAGDIGTRAGRSRCCARPRRSGWCRPSSGLIDRGVLLSDLGVSLWRLVIGLAVAAVIGIPLGLLVGLSGVAERAGGPIIAFCG